MSFISPSFSLLLRNTEDSFLPTLLLYTPITGCLVIFVAFIPFFAFRELGRVLGEGKIRTLFFRKRDDLRIEEARK